MMGIWLEKVWRVNRERIPYAIYLSPTGYFDSSGKFVASETGVGLTCSTFVMTLFSSFAIDLVDVDSWNARADDQAFQAFVCTEMMANKQIDPDHVAAQIEHFGKAPRFRPEEVAASAALFVGDPIKFEVAVPAGNELLIKLRAINVARKRNETE